MKTRQVILIIATMTFFTLINPIAKGNLLINGSFEFGIVTGASYVTVPSGSTAITGWIVTGANIDLKNTYWQASDGSKSLDLNGTPGIGGIEQSFSTIVGQRYKVQFDQAANPAYGARISSMEIQAAGQTAQYAFDCTGHWLNNMGWVTRTWQFMAIDTTTTLEFFSLDTNTRLYGPALDNVVVTAIPEPATMSLLGLGGMVLLKRRK